jgi:hypothetical protein
MLWIANAMGEAPPEGATPPKPIFKQSHCGGEVVGEKVPQVQAGGGAGGRRGGGGAKVVDISRMTLDAPAQNSHEAQPVDELERLRSYDPCLMLLLEWMTESDKAKRADMMDVLRHP